jgi:hypothetical protein
MLTPFLPNWTKGWVARGCLVAGWWKMQIALLLSILIIGCAGSAELSGAGGHGGGGVGGAADGSAQAGGSATGGATGGGASGGGRAARGGGGGSAGGGAASGGLASDYPGDVGIGADPDVIWAESFDQASVGALTARYTAARNPRNMALVTDSPAGAGNPSSLKVTATSRSTGGSLYRYLDAGHEEIYLRYYIKYTDSVYHHTTVYIGGVNPIAQPFITQGAIGLCCTAPDGDKALAVSAEVYRRTGSVFLFDFYNYWFEMKAWGDIVTPRVGATEPDPITGQLKVPAAGNSFLVDSRPIFLLNRWYSVEIHVKLNTPANHDGLLGLWIDGHRIQEFGPGTPKGTYVGTNFRPDPAATQSFPGLRYRNDAVLKLNYMWITHYATQVPSGATSVVYYDQLVLAKRYVGPIKP